MSRAPATDIGPFPGREDEPVPAPALLAKHALALYWAALDVIDALEVLDLELHEANYDYDSPQIKALRARVFEAETRLRNPLRAIRVPLLEARQAQPARPAWPFPPERADALF